MIKSSIIFLFIVQSVGKTGATFLELSSKVTCTKLPHHHHQHYPKSISISKASKPLVEPLLSSKSNYIHQDEDGNCIFGKKSYWDSMYSDNGEQDEAYQHKPSDSYSWYCGWVELKPFWDMFLSSKEKSKVQTLIAGMGNDPTPIDMYDDGWSHMIAFDYSETGVKRAKQLFGSRLKENSVQIVVADASNLECIEDGSIDATLDKGTLDAIYISGKELWKESIEELGRVMKTDGVVISISRVIDPDEFLMAFDTPQWDNLQDGSLAFAPDGEATIDLGAELFSWRRTDIS